MRSVRLSSTDHSTESLPLLILGDGDDDPLVVAGTSVAAMGRESRMAVPRRLDVALVHGIFHECLTEVGGEVLRLGETVLSKSKVL